MERSHSFMPFVNGVRQIRMRIPTRPVAVPAIILPHTMVRHIPTPKASVPAITAIIVKIIFPESRMGFLCSIFLHTSSVIRAISRPAQPHTSPGRKAAHSGIRAIHHCNKTTFFHVKDLLNVIFIKPTVVALI